MALSNNYLEGLLKGQLNNSTEFQAATRGIGNLTSQRVQDALSRLSTSGLGRTGISGSLLNNIYAKAGDSYANAASKESSRRTQIIHQLLGLQKQEDSQFGIGDVFGSILGLGLGSVLGPLGAGVGKKLSGLLTGSGGGGGNLFLPSVENTINSGPFVSPDTTLHL